MSYVALVTDHFNEVCHFYRELLGLPLVEQWDSDYARGMCFDAGGMRLEILDNNREQFSPELENMANRIHLVIEVEDIDQARAHIKVDRQAIVKSPWGEYTFLVHDPDGIPITYLQLTKN